MKRFVDTYELESGWAISSSAHTVRVKTDCFYSTFNILCVQLQ